MERKIRHKKDFDKLVKEDEQIFTKNQLQRQDKEFKKEIDLLDKLKSKIKKVVKFHPRK
ncbi:hypothetical protein HN419_05765 [Candidatus Woesearchaeota archaeon]|jgi:hypothetical protein|nr:hypothetical protein [Candidatus Woesearchaeota archaeon]MBT7928777.1 hypothetical protein [Candidatus Peregrinibacteria bacterium]MBT3537623.1 hypothetical protein [Candidatus Woesearchaeota archaeon]MBT4698443.1 hypothetical protein [Candidatus Woesearchaeota archaeon]MBT4716648.1 hypothetical protein [Candidatus Woesearchaeota archaeon]